MESDSPEIAPLLYAYCYACVALRRAAKIAAGPNPSPADVQRLKDAHEFLGATKRAYFDAVEKRAA